MNPLNKEMLDDKCLTALEGCCKMTAGSLVRLHIDHLKSLITAARELERVKRDPVREHFCACPNCEPVMCCNGSECGCMGLPIDFKPTDKCDGYCLNKTHHDLHAAQQELMSIRAENTIDKATINQQANKISELERKCES
jgi:hypothetical protein